MINYVPKSRKPIYYAAAAIVVAGIAIGSAYFIIKARAERFRALEPASATDDGPSR